MVFRDLSTGHHSEDEDPWRWNPVPDEVGDRDLLGVEVQRIADQLVALIEEVVHPHGDSPVLLRELVFAQHDGATGDGREVAIMSDADPFDIGALSVHGLLWLAASLGGTPPDST